MRSGIVYLPGRNGGTFVEGGQWGSTWLYQGGLTDLAYLFIFSPSIVYLVYGPSARYYTRPLRCLSTVLDI